MIWKYIFLIFLSIILFRFLYVEYYSNDNYLEKINEESEEIVLTFEYNKDFFYNENIHNYFFYNTFNQDHDILDYDLEKYNKYDKNNNILYKEESPINNFSETNNNKFMFKINKNFLSKFVTSILAGALIYKGFLIAAGSVLKIIPF